MKEQKPELLNYVDLLNYYGLKKSTVNALIGRDEFVKRVKVGRKNFFRTSDIEKWIDDNTIDGGKMNVEN